MTARATLLAALRRVLPRTGYGKLRAFYHWFFKEVYLRPLGFWEAAGGRGDGVQPVPPPRLRYRIQGVSGAKAFVKGGARCVDNLQESLRRASVVVPATAEVLDFGCGCGRTLIPLARRFPGFKLHGTDIDGEAIAWCKAHLNAGSFTVNGVRPPLPYPEGFFDFVYALSVFTHLDEELQFDWLDELYRILRPGGHLLATVHGEAAWGSVPEPWIPPLAEKGFLFLRTDIMKGLLPEWYQAAYHSENYVRTNWQRKFHLVSFQPQGMMNYQDVVILRKRKNECPAEDAECKG